MPKTEKTPSTVLQSLIAEYQINPFSLSKSAHLDYQTVCKILKGKGRVTVPTAIKLGKFFGQTPAYWLEIQSTYEINELSKNKKFVSLVKSISKAQKPSANAKNTSKRNKANTIAEKRIKAAKVPGTRAAKRKKTK